MKLPNFSDENIFRELERAAYDAQLDFSEFPAAEYRFFDRVQAIGQRVRFEGYPKQFAANDIKKYRADYENDIDARQDSLRAYRAYLDNTLRVGSLVNEIYKAAPSGKLRFALECVELLTGEAGLAARNLKGE